MTDLGAAERFYSEVLGLELIAKAEGRHVFFRCGKGVLLLFNAEATRNQPAPDAKLPVPPHGTAGEGHLCFAATADEIDRWKTRSRRQGHRHRSRFRMAGRAAARSISAILPAIRSNSPNRDLGALMRALEGRKIVVASHNAGKLREFADLMAPFGFEAKSAKELGLPEPDETGTTFEENAYIKASAAASATGLPALADDSGLMVDALGGAPGVYTANWAETPDGTRDFDIAMQRAEVALQEVGAVTPEQRKGRFVAVICLAWPDGEAEYFRGEAEGTLVWPPRGDSGFGYDPVFQPDGHERTFGEMTAEEKHGWKPGQAEALSHRARAFQKFARALLGST